MATRGRPRYPDILTPREWEVYYLVRMGLTNREIAEWLGVSFSAAKYHVAEVLGKLGVRRRAGLLELSVVPALVRTRGRQMPRTAAGGLRQAPAEVLAGIPALVLVVLALLSTIVSAGQYPYLLPALGLGAVAAGAGVVVVLQRLAPRES